MFRLKDIYTGDELEMVRFDLERATNLIDVWLAGGAVDADMARYAGFALLSLVERTLITESE